MSTTRREIKTINTREIVLTHEDIRSLFREKGVEIEDSALIDLITEENGSCPQKHRTIFPTGNRVVFRVTSVS